MARRQATEEQRAEVRAGIRRAATKVYREKGVSGVSARAIALAAGVSVGTIYAHFGDLPSLMQSLWMEPLEQINERFREIASEHLDPVRRIRALLAAYVEVARDNPDLYRNAFLFVRPNTLKYPEQRPIETIAFADLLLAAVRDGQAIGQIRAGSIERLVQMLWAGVHGCIALPINFDRLQIEETQTLAADMIDALVSQLA